jgi:hypothetical protein
MGEEPTLPMKAQFLASEFPLMPLIGSEFIRNTVTHVVTVTICSNLTTKKYFSDNFNVPPSQSTTQ